MGPQLFL